MSPVIKLSSPPTGQFWEIPVLYEDDSLLALNKPPGLPASPGRSDPTQPSLLSLLHAGIAAGKPWARQRGLSYLMSAHRLETEAGGVLLFARSKPVFLELANRFNTGRSGREFVALAQGVAREDRFNVEAPLAPDLVRPGLLRVDRRRGKRSCTLFEVVERFRDFTLLRCEPSPARPHQIRVHLRSAALPLVGDPFFSGRPLLLSRLKTDYRLKPGAEERPLLDRPAFHAVTITLTHPVTAQTIVITSPWPKDLTVAVKYLRRYAAA